MTPEIATAVPDMAAMVAAIIERPLFSPARHPLEIVAAQIGEMSEGTPQKLRGRLAGVLISPGVREALFARQGQKPIAVNIGSEIDGWKIAYIEPDRVILSNALGNQTVKPTTDSEGTRPSARAINTNLATAQPVAASAAAALSNPGNRAAGSRATPNPMRNPIQFAGQTDPPGRR